MSIGYPGVRVTTQFDPFNDVHDAMIRAARETGEVQVGQEPSRLWLLAIPSGQIFWLSVVNAVDDPYIREAIGYEVGMSYDEVARRLGEWQANHIEFCSKVRTADPDGLGITRRASS
jgi:heptaprenylglyceryl phosphate synthase